MHEIKFRGRRTDNGEWLHGYYMRYGWTGEVKDHIMTEGASVLYAYEVDPATVGQFTGWQDVDGFDLYDGDVVEFLGDRCYCGTIVYEGTSFMVKADGITDTLDSIDVEGQNLLLIGTIHGEAG